MDEVTRFENLANAQWRERRAWDRLSYYWAMRWARYQRYLETRIEEGD